MSAFRRNAALASQGHKLFNLWKASEHPLWPWPDFLCECRKRFLRMAVERGLRRIDLIGDILRWIRSGSLEAIDSIWFGFSHELDSLEGPLLKCSLLPGVHKNRAIKTTASSAARERW
jgi:hypothetical protein